MRAQRAEKIFAFYMCAKRSELIGGTLNFWGAPRGGERLIGGERLSLGTPPGGGERLIRGVRLIRTETGAIFLNFPYLRLC